MANKIYWRLNIFLTLSLKCAHGLNLAQKLFGLVLHIHFQNILPDIILIGIHQVLFTCWFCIQHSFVSLDIYLFDVSQPRNISKLLFWNCWETWLKSINWLIHIILQHLLYFLPCFNIWYFSLRIIIYSFKTIFAFWPLKIGFEWKRIAMLLSTLFDQKLECFTFILFLQCLFNCFFEFIIVIHSTWHCLVITTNPILCCMSHFALLWSLRLKSVVL